MTAAADEAWIQNSLARLETLEAERTRLAATGSPEQLAEIDEEISSLYEVLESVAGEEEPAAPAANAAAPLAAVAAPVAAVPAMAPVAPAMGSPLNQAPMAAAPAMASPMATPMATANPSIDFDDDIKPPRGPLPLILVGLLVIGGGVGAFLMFGQSKKEPPKQEANLPATIIKAGAVVEDTQEPQVAKGADADRTQGTHFKEGSSRPSRAKRRGGSRSRPRRDGKKGADDRKVKVDNTRDPLAGVN